MTPPDNPVVDLPAVLDELHESEQRLLRTVDSLAPDQWAEPSTLPGWSRAHVAAHLALNAEGLAGAVDGLVREHLVPVYASAEQRDSDIDALARAEPSELRERLFAGSQGLRDTLQGLDAAQWQGVVARVPGGPDWPVVALPTLRRREVEIHHADLAAGYRHTDWPADFCIDLLDEVTRDHADSADSPDFAVLATDADRTWAAGADRPVVSGSAADLGWWLVGRGSGEDLSCDSGDLPRLGPWRRTPVK